MSGSLNRLVPVLDGMNYCGWSVLMQSYLQMQELWEVVDGNWRIPAQPTSTTTGTGANAVTTQPTDAEREEYQEKYDSWNTADDKATGSITLRISPQLWHYRAVNQTA
jgi:hypothetical protein